MGGGFSWVLAHAIAYAFESRAGGRNVAERDCSSPSCAGNPNT